MRFDANQLLTLKEMFLGRLQEPHIQGIHP